MAWVAAWKQHLQAAKQSATAAVFQQVEKPRPMQSPGAHFRHIRQSKASFATKAFSPQEAQQGPPLVVSDRSCNESLGDRAKLWARASVSKSWVARATAYFSLTTPVLRGQGLSSVQRLSVHGSAVAQTLSGSVVCGKSLQLLTAMPRGVLQQSC